MNWVKTAKAKIAESKRDGTVVQRIDENVAEGASSLIRALIEQSRAQGLEFTISVMASNAGSAVVYFDAE